MTSILIKIEENPRGDLLYLELPSDGIQSHTLIDEMLSQVAMWPCGCQSQSVGWFRLRNPQEMNTTDHAIWSRATSRFTCFGIFGEIVQQWIYCHDILSLC